MTKEMKWSSLSVWFCMVFITITAIFIYPKWTKENTEATISWDASGYYFYLPAHFIFNDLKKCQFKDSIIQKYQPTPNFLQGFEHQPSKNNVMKYTCGQAIVMFPFFKIADIWTQNQTKYPRDGFSFPYQIAIGLGMLMIGLVGLFFYKKVLLLFFNDAITAILLLVLTLGTNYLNYTAIDQAMTHNSLFVGYVFLMYSTHKYFQYPSFKHAGIIGLIIGLMILIRPTECISVLIPLLYNVHSISDFKNKLKIFIKNLNHLFFVLILIFSILSIQFFYWKFVCDQWFVYSYQEQGFNWVKPHFLEYTIHPKSGWLLYTPMMILSLIGIPLVWFTKSKNYLLTTLFILLNFYIITAWNDFSYGSFAGRAAVQSYVLMMIPLGEMLNIIRRKKRISYTLSVVIVLFTYLNIWFTYFSHLGKIDLNQNSYPYYFKVVGRWQAHSENLKLKYVNHIYEGVLSKIDTLYYEPNLKYNTTFANSGTSDTILIDNYKLQKQWLRVYGKFKIENKQWDVWQQSYFNVQIYYTNGKIKNQALNIERFLNEQEELELYFDVKLIDTINKIQVFIKKDIRNQLPLMYKNICVIAFDESISNSVKK